MCSKIFSVTKHPCRANKTSFLSYILITMHFPILAKSWIKYICTEQLLKPDMQPHQTIDLRIENTPKFVSPILEPYNSRYEFYII